MLLPLRSQALREFARVRPDTLPGLGGIDLLPCQPDQARLCADVAGQSRDKDATDDMAVQACLKDNYRRIESDPCKSEVCVCVCVCVFACPLASGPAVALRRAPRRPMQALIASVRVVCAEQSSHIRRNQPSNQPTTEHRTRFTGSWCCSTRHWPSTLSPATVLQNLMEFALKPTTLNDPMRRWSKRNPAVRQDGRRDLFHVDRRTSSKC